MQTVETQDRAEAIDAFIDPAIEPKPIEVNHRARFKHTLFVEVGENVADLVSRTIDRAFHLLTQINWTAVLVACVGLLTVLLMRGQH